MDIWFSAWRTKPMAGGERDGRISLGAAQQYFLNWGVGTMTTNLEPIWQFDLRRGHSKDPRNGACLLDVVSWFEYGTLGDHPPSVCPVIAAYARVLNDLLPDDRRQELKRYILRLLGTCDPPAERARAEYLIWQAIHVFAPAALEATGIEELLQAAQRLRDTADFATAATAADAARAVAADAARAAATARAAAAARAAARVAARAAATARAAAADRAVATAAVAADATDPTWATATAADAVVYAIGAAAKNVRTTIYDLAFAALDGVLRIGRQAEPVMLDKIENANRTFAIAIEQ